MSDAVEWPKYIIDGVCEVLDCRPSEAMAKLQSLTVQLGKEVMPDDQGDTHSRLDTSPGVTAGAVPSPDVAALVEAAVKAERDRIIDALRDEADMTPCDEDAVVVRDCADLIEVDFSYEDAERLKEARLKGGAA